MAQPSKHQTEVKESRESEKDVDRIGAFSDAIFAFSMTVLAVEIVVPSVPTNELPQAIVEQVPHFISFVVGFLVVAMYWAGHHRMFRYMRRVDGRLIWTNILLLMLIAFMPVPTGYLGEYTTIPLVAAIYAMVIIAMSFVELFLWHHAETARLIDPHLPKRLIRLYQWRMRMPIFVFVLSIILAFSLGATVAEYSWALLLPAHLLLTRHYRDVVPHIYGEI